METLIVVLIVLGAITFLAFSFRKNMNSDGCSGCSCSDKEKNKCGQTFEFPPKKDDKSLNQ